MSIGLVVLLWQEVTVRCTDVIQAFLDQYLLDSSATGNVDPSWPDPALLGYLNTKPDVTMGP